MRTYVGNRPRPQPLDQQQPRALTKIPSVKPDYELPRVLLSNTRSLTNKLDELTGVMELNNVDVAAITETWVTRSVPEKYLQISGYTVHFWCRDRQGGGAALYVRESIPVQRIKVNVPEELECIWLMLRPHRLPRQVSYLIIAAVYNPPKAPTEHLLMDHLPTLQCL